MSDDRFKFRCFDPIAKEMLYVESGISFFYDRDNGFHAGYNDHRGDWVDCPVMQSTGLKDKNGKLIFEGDVYHVAGYGKMIIEWPFVELFEHYWEDDVERYLGNIYENPELLEGKE